MTWSCDVYYISDSVLGVCDASMDNIDFTLSWYFDQEPYVV